MPTVIVLDVSLSMCRPVPSAAAPDTPEDEIPTRRTLAIEVINQFLQHISTHCKLEFVTLITFSTLFEIITPFDRDLDAIRGELSSISTYDCTNYEAMLSGILLITDGSGGFGPGCLKDAIKSAKHFPFPAKMNIITLSDTGEKNYTEGCQMLQRLIDVTCGDGMVYFPENHLTSKGCSSALSKLCAKDFTPYKGFLRCGNLVSKITLCPPPQPFVSRSDEKRYDFSEAIDIVGFIEGNDLSSPAAHSRHLLLPLKSDCTFPSSKSEDSEEDIDGKTPNFCVLLHGALKVDNKCALVEVGNNWYGFIYTWQDNKKKSNLMLSILPPGTDVVPWLGNMQLLGPLEEFVTNRSIPTVPTFPVKPPEKKSYGGSPTVWITPDQVNNDMVKLLRNCKKLPDKNNAFYKELNRIRRWALAIGFESILESVAQILERECMVSTSTHPDASIQLTHAATQLRTPAAYSKTITPHSSH
ncbi:von Willebrand factor A domain-containing protein 9 [Folsomia candida]|uniref:Integrator complex subunit 14 n=1 Tax=Folsomia candida TaxID=158441 RepID=A0A226EQ31_FOLCA|nr:von Willebrand factor A domain-containing protein 9 [Folsomia candida]